MGQSSDFDFSPFFGNTKPSTLPLPSVPSENSALYDCILALCQAQPVQPPPPSGIFFGRDNGGQVQFSEPHRFPYSLTPPPFEALYAILVADNGCRPRPYRPIYFGQTGNMSNRPTLSHEHFDDWCRVANGRENLFVSYAWMIGSSEAERTNIEEGLIKRYNPVCNIQFNSFFGEFLQGRGTAVPGAFGASKEPDFYAQIAQLARLLGSK